MNSAVSITPTGKPVRAEPIGPADRRTEILFDFPDRVVLPLTARMTLYVLALLIVIAIIGAAFAEIDVVVVAQGKLTTSDQLTVLQPFELAVVREVRIKVGDHVTAGEILATLDPTIVEADSTDAENKVRTTSVALKRISAEIAGDDFAPASSDAAGAAQREIFSRRKSEEQAKKLATEEKLRGIAIQIEQRRAIAPYLSHQLEISEEAVRLEQYLSDRGLGTKPRLLDLKKAVEDMGSRIVGNSSEEQNLLQQQEQARSEFLAYLRGRERELAEEYEKTRSGHDEAKAKQAKAALRDKLVALTSPVSGTVLEVAKRARGSVVREAETLITIVPDGSALVANIKIETRDISRVRTDDLVTMKLESLPYQQYGTLEGRLTVIAPDALSGEQQSDPANARTTSDSDADRKQQRVYYSGEVELTRNKLHSVPSGFSLRPGMKVSAEINVGRRTVLEYLLNPITRGLHEAMREP